MARKEKKAGPPTTSLMYVGMACFFIVGAGAGYLWHKSQIHTLGQQLRGYEMQLETAKRRRLTLERTYAAMCSFEELDRLVKRMRLEIGPPQLDQIVKLPENSGIGQDERLLARRPMPPGEEGAN
jgi:hypothetical protein